MRKTTHTLFQRLEAHAGIGLNFEYMGAAEYEFGSAHAALNLLVEDLGIPHEVIDTNIIPVRADSPMSDIDHGPRRRETKKAFNARAAEYGHVEAMLDGQPLRLRHIPSLNRPEEFETLMGLKSTEEIYNKGGLWRRDTLAWLSLYPVPGILYHPSQEDKIEPFLDAIRALRAEKEPDADKRAIAALTKMADGRSDSVDLNAVKAARQKLVDGDSPAP